MLAGVPVSTDATAELASMVRAVGADELADRLDEAIDDEVKLLALTIDERAIILLRSRTRRMGSRSSAAFS